MNSVQVGFSGFRVAFVVGLTRTAIHRRTAVSGPDLNHYKMNIKKIVSFACLD